MKQITVHPTQVDRLIKALIKTSDDLLTNANTIVTASCKAGLPGYATRAGSAASDAEKAAASMLALANVLSVRKSLMVIAMGDPMMSMRIRSLEMQDPDGFWRQLQGIAVSAARDYALSSDGMKVGSEATQRVAALLLGDMQLPKKALEETMQRIQKVLGQGTKDFWQQIDQSPGWRRAMLAAANAKTAAGRAAQGAARGLAKTSSTLAMLEDLGKGTGGVVLSGLLAGSFQALSDWRSGIRDHRVERVAVSAGASAGATIIAAGICVVGGLETGGLACAGIVVISGVGGSLAADAWNDSRMSERDRLAQMTPQEREHYYAMKEYQRMEQWYIKYGKPTHADLNDQLQYASKKSYLHGGPGDRLTVVEYRRPDGSLLMKEEKSSVMFGREEVKRTWFDPKGRVIKP